MPIRLIGTLVVAALAAIFTGFNLDNKCDVWLINTFNDVPVAFTIILSLLAGVVITLPFTLGRRLTREEKIKLREVQKQEKRAAKLQKKNQKKVAKKPAPAPVVVVEAEPVSPQQEAGAVPEPPAPEPEPELLEQKLLIPEQSSDEGEKKDTKSE